MKKWWPGDHFFLPIRAPCRLSLRTSSDELQTCPDNFGLTAKSSGRVRTNFKLWHPVTPEFEFGWIAIKFVRMSSDELQIQFRCPSTVDGRVRRCFKIVRINSEKLQTCPDVGVEIGKIANSSGRVRTKFKLVRTSSDEFDPISSGRVPCKNANSTPSVDRQRTNSDKFQTLADEFGRG